MKFLNNFSVRKLLMNKKIAIALSVVVAFFFWLIISIEETTELERTINKVQIEVNANDILGNKDLKVVGDISQTASVKVHGPNYIVSVLSSDDLIVEADVSKINGAGEYELSLLAMKKDGGSGFSIISMSPSTINVKLDYYESKTIDATAVIEGYTRADNDDLIYDSVFTTSNRTTLPITVKGFRNDLNKLSAIEVRANTDEVISETKIFPDSEIVLLDKEGKELEQDNYELSVESASIALTVSKEKLVTVTPAYNGVWNSNIVSALMSCWSSDIKTLTLKGPPETIDSIKSLEYVNPIGLSELAASSGKTKSFELTPKLPDGVSISDATQTVTFTFDLSKLGDKKFRINSFDDEGTLAQGINVSYDNQYWVTVCGLKNTVKSLDEADLYLYVDLSSIKQGDSGTKSVRGILKAKDNSAVWMIGNCDVTVKIQ